MVILPSLLTALLDDVAEGVCHTNLERRIVYWNGQASRITGYRLEEVLGQRCQDGILRHVDTRGRELCSTEDCPLLVPLRTKKSYQRDLFLHHREGHLIPVTVRTIPLVDSTGSTLGVSQFVLPHEKRQSKSKLGRDWKQEALTDALTGLGNRRAFRQNWARAHRSLITRGSAFGLLMVDIDRFKEVNDNHGHALGDKVLRMVARTLAGCIRKNDAAIRWGGEEFVVLVCRATQETLADLAERMRLLVERGWVALADGSHLSVTVSVGGAMIRPEDTVEDLVSRADRRLYECKVGGRNRSQIGD